MKDTLFNRNFCIPDRKYYLADTRYYNTDYLLYSYHEIYYYFTKQAMAEKPNLSIKKNYSNFCYSSLYNVIERIFEINK